MLEEAGTKSKKGRVVGGERGGWGGKRISQGLMQDEPGLQSQDSRQPGENFQQEIRARSSSWHSVQGLLNAHGQVKLKFKWLKIPMMNNLPVCRPLSYLRFKTWTPTPTS